MFGCCDRSWKTLPVDLVMFVPGSFLLRQMVLKIRKAVKGDVPALSRIYLLTANTGSSPEEL